jgi:hypothetical protein
VRDLDLGSLLLLLFLLQGLDLVLIELLKHEGHVPVQDLVLVVLEVYHIHHLVVEFLGKEDVHEFLPPDVACLLGLLPLPFLSKHEFCFHSCLQLRVILVVREEFL